MWVRLHSSRAALCSYVRQSRDDVGAFALLSRGPLWAQGAMFGGHAVMWVCLRSSRMALFGLRGLCSAVMR